MFLKIARLEQILNTVYMCETKVKTKNKTFSSILIVQELLIIRVSNNYFILYKLQTQKPPVKKQKQKTKQFKLLIRKTMKHIKEDSLFREIVWSLTLLQLKNLNVMKTYYKPKSFLNISYSEQLCHLP